MNPTESILQHTTFDGAELSHLESSAKWAKFIGIVYFIFSALIFLSGIFIVSNVDRFIPNISQVYGMSEQAQSFLMGAGKWLFLVLLLIIIAVLGINAICLIRFRNSQNLYSLSNDETSLNSSFDHLRKYFVITTLLGLASLMVSFVAVLINLM